MPKSNSEYWSQKIKRNTIRDKKNKKELKKQGWKIITLWECQVKRESSLYQRIRPLLELKKYA